MAWHAVDVEGLSFQRSKRLVDVRRGRRGIFGSPVARERSSLVFSRNVGLPPMRRRFNRTHPSTFRVVRSLPEQSSDWSRSMPEQSRRSSLLPAQFKWARRESSRASKADSPQLLTCKRVMWPHGSVFHGARQEQRISHGVGSKVINSLPFMR